MCYGSPSRRRRLSALSKVRVRTLASDFKLEDTWEFPYEFGAEDGVDLHVFQKRAIEPMMKGIYDCSVTGLLFTVRKVFGALFRIDASLNNFPIPGCREKTLRERLRESDLEKDTPERAMDISTQDSMRVDFVWIGALLPRTSDGRSSHERPVAVARSTIAHLHERPLFRGHRLRARKSEPLVHDSTLRGWPRTLCPISCLFPPMESQPCSDLDINISTPPCLLGGKRPASAGCRFSSHCQRDNAPIMPGRYDTVSVCWRTSQSPARPGHLRRSLNRRDVARNRRGKRWGSARQGQADLCRL